MAKARRRRPRRRDDAKTNATPKTEEMGRVKRAFDIMPGLGIDTKNPDKTVQKFGLKYFEQEMELKDAQYRNVIRIRKTAVLARDWDIIPASDDPVDVEKAEWVKWNLERIEGTWRQDLLEILDAISVGYSVSEKIWELLTEGQYAGKWRLQALRHKPPALFEFVTDEFGRLKDDGLRLRAQGETLSRPLPRDKFVHMVSDSKYENPYGRGLASTCVWYVWFKKNAAKFLLVFLEKWGSPTAKAKIPPNPGAGELERVQEILETIQQTTGFWYPEGFEIELLEASRSGSAGYEHMLAWCDEQIAKAALGQPGTTESGKTSSYASKKSDLVVQDEIVQGDTEAVEALVNDQIVPQTVDYNYYGTEVYPRFTFIREKRTAELGPMLFRILLEAGQPVGVDWISENYGISKPKEGEQVLVMPERTAGGFSGPGGGLGAGTGTASEGFDSTVFHVEHFIDEPDELLRFTQAAADALDVAAMASVPRANQIVREATDRWLSALEAAEVVESGDIAAAIEVPLDFEGLDNEIYEALYWANLKGITDGQIRLMAHGWRPANRAAALTARATALRFADLAPRSIPSPQAALDYFGRLQVVKRDVYDKAKLRGQATTISYAQTQAALKTAHWHLTEAIQNGWSFQRFRDALLDDQTFSKAYRPADGTSANAHLETVFRTNLNGAYNQGRLDMFNDPELGDFVEGYEYNALMDGRERPAHGAMNGKRYRKGNPIWLIWTPPCGYNCRCFLEPVTQMDEPWKENAEPDKTVRVDGVEWPLAPDKGFGRPGSVSTKAEERIKEKIAKGEV